MNLVEHTRMLLGQISDQSKDGYLLAVSGGKDSMVLLDVFHNLGVSFMVAHMNYGLREGDSDLDEALVESVCREKGIKFISKKVDTKKYCLEHGMSTQEGARILRYNWFNELLESEKLKWIVTAHHEEDNKETFIQNLKRGSGLRGLKSMTIHHENKLKPLLTIARGEIDQYALENKVDFRQDASNNQNHYQRNLIRNKLLPMMEEELNGIGQGISRSIENLQQDYNYLRSKLNEEADQTLQKKENEWVVTSFRDKHPRLLFHILEDFGFNNQQVLDLIRSNTSGKKIENEKYVVVDGHGDLYIYENVEDDSIDLEIFEPGRYNIGKETIVISEAEKPTHFSANKLVAYVDANKVAWPLKVRDYQRGDRIKPIGMKGSKKLSDYFTDAKIPVHQRSNKKVVVSNGEIIWVVGELMSENVKIVHLTKKVLKFETLG